MTSSTAGTAVSHADETRPGVIGGAIRLAERVLALGAASHPRAAILLVLLGLACFLPGIVSLQPMDRDEPRFAQASKQMLETGDLVDIRFQGEARHKKPVGIYWAQAAAVGAAEALGVPEARSRIFFYRIPSLLGALAAALLTYWAALAFLERRGALLAAALFTACIDLAAEARLAKTDALLAACAVAAMGALARVWLGRVRLTRERAPAGLGTTSIFWLALALGILVKGPMVPMFAGLAILVLCIREGSARWLSELRFGSGLLLVLAIVAPWFIAIAWKTGGEFFAASVGKDMLAKVGSGTERHWGPPGFYAIAFFATFWPAAIFSALAIPFAWVNRRDDHVVFLLAWIVPSWIVFEAVATKLPHYVLPLYPAVAILTVVALVRGGFDPDRRGARTSAGLVVLIPVGLTIGLSAVAWSFDHALPLTALPFLLIACILSWLAWAAFSRRAVEAALGIGIAASVVLSSSVFGLVQPVLASLKVSPRLGAVRDALPCKAAQVATFGYREPSFVFTIGTDLDMVESGEAATAFLKQGGCRLIFVEGRYAKAFADAIAAANLHPSTVATVSGFNINTGRRTEVTAYAAGLDPASPTEGAQ
ncbi:ArnT family glycosyltransferase [Methylobacterium gnaphalii]|uniref:Glycosyl transferase n=1 Tax=Methylobacterium gnaphalii TaxID=1010610 RepID=A0A512JNE7_9HYPH|nr:phospholipid carrier-dependent glycosyltransferase [Methylobacterium gnaphalii]GEP11487.1 glycosyl transferase [Methylobacterium gnaphalii]GJD70179.1 Undecaprenyl phosphate-alpha-4-amino-4-deoxy-L-arabinose arabinosyl transferase [Methylobacterium gnaphalii]GLS49491.1 glycosyl transferase [Methylobacterium gnaphalii]